MIDLKLLEKNFDEISKRLKLKGVDEEILKKVKSLFEEKKSLKQKIDLLLQERNSLSKNIGLLMKEGKKEKAEEVKKRVLELKKEIEEIEKKLGISIDIQKIIRNTNF